MSIRSKFDGGKIFNSCNRGSWHSRCYGSGLRMNYGPEWSPIVFKGKTRHAPGNYFSRLYINRHRQVIYNNKYNAKKTTKEKRWKKKIASAQQSKTLKAKMSYGPKAIDVVPDVKECELEKSMVSFYQKNVCIKPERIEAIEKCTIDQSHATYWAEERRQRITASDFASIIKKEKKKHHVKEL